MLNVLVVLAAIIQILVGLLVYRKKRTSFTNITFGLISITSLAWAITNYIYTLNPISTSALEVIRLILFFVVLQNTVFYIFAHNYPSDSRQLSNKRLAFFLSFSAIAAAATLSPFVFTSVAVSHGQSNPNAGPLIIIFMAHALYSIGTSLGSLIGKMRRFEGIQRKQVKFILFASILTWVLVPITNFVITLTLHTTFFAKVSPLYTLAFGAIIAYAIVAQRLFSIQAAIARSVAYTMTIVTLAAAYVAVVFAVSSLFLNSSATGLRTQATYTVLALILAFTFEPVKRRFDRVTTRLFYQDSYNPQEVIDKLNRALVATVESDKLLMKTLQIIEEYLKVEFSVAVLAGPERPRIVGSSKKMIEFDDLTAIYSRLLVRKTGKSSVVADSLRSDNVAMRQVLEQNNIAIMVRLAHGGKLDKKEFGYLVLGPKKSGNPFSNLDVNVIEAIANELAIAIDNALQFEEIQLFNKTLQDKIVHATQELRHSNHRLRQLDSTKDDFISMASHQLRTPLTSVKGYLSMVLDGDAGELNDNQRKLLDQAFRSSQQMVYLISDLLNLSRINTGKFVIEPSPVDLSDTVQFEFSQLSETAKARNVTLTYAKPAAFPTLMLDETKTHQVIMNLMDNAIYYTPSGGTVTVILKETPTTVEYTVTDTGIGVPKSVQHKLFAKFYRAGNAQKARPDGTGLGLFMAKKVIAAQGGAIIFESEEGKGSTFGFRFNKTKLTPAKE